MNRLLLAFLLFNPGFAIAEIEVSINESYSNNIEVSGEFLKGLQLASTTDEKSLHVHFPKGSKGDLCIELTSIDGKYKADIKAEITSSVSGMEPIPFDSKYPELLRNYPNNEIAILARIERRSDEQCSGNGLSRRLISSWSSDISKKLILLIRSDARKDVAYFRNKDNPGKKCKKFRKAYNVSYDKYCALENVDFNYFEEIEIQIDRKNLQNIDPETIYIN